MMDWKILHSKFGEGIAQIMELDPGSRLGEFAKFLDCSEEAAAKTLAEISGLKFLPKFTVDDGLLKELPYQLLVEYKILPIGIRNNVLPIVCCWPLAPDQIKWIAVATGYAVECLLATPEAIVKFIGESFGLSSSTAQCPDTEQIYENVENDEASVIRFVNDLLRRCMDARATDIHFEPQRASLIIRYRVDGDLVIARVPENLKNFQAAIISRLKIMAKLNISEKRRPQDGKFSFKMQQRMIDVRLSTLPTTYGESVSLRILSDNNSPIELDDIGLSEGHGTLLLNSLKCPNGLILVTGPTGSGKSTTLSACLRKLRSPNKRLMTVEDPIEYEIQGVNQTQVNPEIELTFANVLRSILRQDPDIIMIGEIRDLETAEIAVRAAITGHLVLSTLHTNDSTGTITRLRDIGIKNFLLSSAIRLIVAQRLVRKLCPYCAVREEFKAISKREAEGVFKAQDLSKALTAKGCDRCDGLGYRGRVGIFEILEIDDVVRDAITNHKSEAVIREIAMKRLMLSLKDDLIDKIQSGTTSIGEAMRIIEH